MTSPLSAPMNLSCILTYLFTQYYLFLQKPLSRDNNVSLEYFHTAKRASLLPRGGREPRRGHTKVCRPAFKFPALNYGYSDT